MTAAAPWPRRVSAQAGMELRLLLRNAENLLVTIGIPLGLLVFFSLVPVLPTDGADPLVFLLPGVLTIALMGSALVALAISTGFEREHLVLKRLGATPLRRIDLVVAKVGAVVALQILQLTALLSAAVALGWRPPAAGASPGMFVVAVGLGTAAFAGGGLALAGRLRALVTLAVVNAVFVVLVLVSGLIFPLAALPEPLQLVVSLLPAAPLADLFAVALEGGVWLPVQSTVALAAWAIGAPVAAARLFRWW